MSDQKVLIVDDNPSDRALVTALLEHKYRVLSAPNAAAGSKSIAPSGRIACC